MTKSIKGTRTEHNLLAAFAGESQARNRYTFFAKAAKKEGFEQISAIFLETADNEKVHAKQFFRFLEGGEVEITATYPAGIVGTTAENLRASAEGEHLEWTKIYKESADVAREEGFPDVGKQFDEIAAVEVEHEKRYLALLEKVEAGTVFKRDGVYRWKCRNCGRIHESTEPPEICPACFHPRAYFEVAAENF